MADEPGDEPDRLLGRRVLVTGASRGIGRALSLEFAKRGARTVLVARDAVGLAATRDAVRALGGEADCAAADLAAPERLEAALEPALGTEGVDALVCCAATSSIGLLEDEPWDALAQMLVTNVHAPVRLAQLVLPKMLARSRGRLVFLSSVAAMGMPASAAYGASKGALLSFSRCLRNELAGTGVSVLHAVIGSVETDMRAQNIDAVKANASRFRFTLPLQAISAEQCAAQLAQAIADGAEEVVIGDDGGLAALQAQGREHSDALVRAHFSRVPPSSGSSGR